jgi:hypothetical protein
MGFSSIAWDNFGNEGRFPLGLLAGGMTDGSVVFWDANDVMEGRDGTLCVIDGIYESPVNTMEFNPYKNNLLAMGG